MVMSMRVPLPNSAAEVLHLAEPFQFPGDSSVDLWGMWRRALAAPLVGDSMNYRIVKVALKYQAEKSMLVKEDGQGFDRRRARTQESV